MKHFILSTCCVVLLAAAPAGAQPTKRPKEAPLDVSFLRDYAETRGFTLGRPVKPKPTPDGKSVLFLRAGPRAPRLRLHEFDVATGRTREVLTPEQVLKGSEEHLTPEEKARRERQRVSVGGFTDYQLSRDGSLILVSLSGRLYVVNRANGEPRELATGHGTLLDPRFAPDGKSIAYVRDYDLYVYDLATQRERRLTTGGTERVTHGLAEFVAQEEMGRHVGFWWAPDGRSIVYQESDAREVEVWYVADPARPEVQAATSYYPRPGKANVKVRVGVLALDRANGKGDPTVWLNWDAARYPYLTQVRWEKNGPLTLTVQTRLQNELVLLQADPATGKTSPLVTERDATWVNLHQEVPRWLEDGSFLWVSEQDGGPRLEWRESSGRLREPLLGPADGFSDLVDLDAKAKQVVVQVTAGDPTQLQLVRLSLADRKREALTEGRGLHSASVTRGSGLWVHTQSAPDALPRSTVRRADGSVVGELPSVAEQPPLMPRIEYLRVGGEPGYYTSVVRPRDFDARKRYPVLVDVYGGPHHQSVLAAARPYLLDQWLADQGFVVVAADNRGTPRRGRDWERAVYKKFGSVPLDDQVMALKALGHRLPELDLERVGIVGWSFGGYMSALAVLRRPDVFKAAVAGAPVVDWLDYDTHYTERYLGLPDADPSAYRESSLLTYAPDLKRPLLLVHGTADDNVYFRHTLKLSNALFRAGRDFEVLPLSGLTHMVPDPVVTQRLWGRIAEHFQRHLGRPKEPATP